jgi:hypothetical protein
MVEAFIIDHLTSSVSNLKKHKLVQFFFPCRKIEIKRIVFFLEILFLNLNLL